MAGKLQAPWWCDVDEEKLHLLPRISSTRKEGKRQGVSSRSSLSIPTPNPLVRLSSSIPCGSSPAQPAAGPTTAISPARQARKEQAAAAAEVARELREAAAALAVRRAADEDALRRSAVALDGDLRRLQGSVAALEPAALDKVEEDLEHANLAILDSHVAAFLPNKGNDLLPFVSFGPFCFGSSLIVSLRVMFKLTMSEPLGKFLKKFVGPVNVGIARKEDKLKVKDGYNNYRDRAAYMFLLFPSILLLLRWWVWDGCLPALALQMYQAWLLFLYTSFALRENVLLINGSDIRP